MTVPVQRIQPLQLVTGFFVFKRLIQYCVSFFNKGNEAFNARILDFDINKFN